MTAPAPPAASSGPGTKKLAGGAVAVVVAGAGAALAVGALRSRETVDPLPPTSTTLLAADLPLHLARRATYGLTPTLLAEIEAAGPTDWLEQQLAPDGIDDAAMDDLLAGYPLLELDAADLQRALSDAPDRRLAGDQLVEATLARQIWSRRQLFEVMVDFWSNHFNVTTPLGPTYATKPVEDRTVIRRHALGRFEDLLVADARSPAMLIHLGNKDSRGDDPNENYGRELLELHTVGVGGGYTEDDVRDSALALTGWGVGEDGTFAFDPTGHHVGRIEVLTWSAANDLAEGGLEVGTDYLRHLAHHEQTARHLSYKLAVRFVSDEPPPELVDRLAAAFLAADTEIVPWLRELFSAPEFAAATGQKVRRPLEDVVASVRALGIGPPPPSATGGIAALVERARGLGQTPLGANPPTGYADVAAEWLSTSAVLGRWNVHRLLTADYFDGLRYPEPTAFARAADARTDGELVDRLAQRLTGQPFRPDHREALLDFLGTDSDAPYDEDSVSGQLPDLTALILDSPYHLLR